MLVDLATYWLVENRVLLPGITTLTRLIARVRDRARRRAWQAVSGQLGPGDVAGLERLVKVDDSGASMLQRLRRAPAKPTIDGLFETLERLGEVQALAGPRRLDLSRVPAGRLRALAQEAATVKAQRVARQTPARRVATLAAFTERLVREAHDDTVDVFLVIAHDLVSRTERAIRRDRLATLDQLDAASHLLRQVALVILDADVADPEVRARVFRSVAPDELRRAVDTVEGTAASGGPQGTARRLLNRYPHVRRFLPALLKRLRLSAATAGHPVIAAVEHLRRVDRGLAEIADAPLEVITDLWRPLALTAAGEIHRPGCTLCVVDRLRLAIKRREVWCPDAERWGDPRRLLLTTAEWRGHAPGSLDLPSRPSAYLARLGAELDAAYRRAAEVIERDSSVSVEADGERDRVHVTRLDAVEEPESVPKLRAAVRDLLPAVDLPEVLVEVDGWTAFTDAFTHVSGARARVPDLALSVCGVLLAQACNVGYGPVSRRDIPALTPARLEWVTANFVRAETIRAANDRLLAYHQTIGLTRRWGAGELASADGLRFVVPVRSVHAGPNPRYFGTGRGAPTTTGPLTSTPVLPPLLSRERCATASSSLTGCWTTTA